MIDSIKDFTVVSYTDDCRGRTDLTHVIVYFDDESQVREICSHAFEGCSNLETVLVYPGITGIGPRAFADCQKLTNVFLPDTITAIGNFCFYGCTSLRELSIPPKAKLGKSVLTNTEDKKYAEGIIWFPKGINWTSQIKSNEVPFPVNLNPDLSRLDRDSKENRYLRIFFYDPDRTSPGSNKSGQILAGIPKGNRDALYSSWGIFGVDAIKTSIAQYEEELSKARVREERLGKPQLAIQHQEEFIAEEMDRLAQNLASSNGGDIRPEIHFASNSLSENLHRIIDAELSVLRATELLTSLFAKTNRTHNVLLRIQDEKRMRMDSVLLERWKTVHQLEEITPLLARRQDAKQRLLRLDADDSYFWMADNHSLPSPPVRPSYPEILSSRAPEPPKQPVYTVPGLFNKKRVERENAKLKAGYDSALGEYQRQLQTRDALKQEYERQCDVFNQQCTDYGQRLQVLAIERRPQCVAEAQKTIEVCDFRLDTLPSNNYGEQPILLYPPIQNLDIYLDGMVEEVYRRYRAVCAERDALYEEANVFGKYRNLPAITSFCEYIDSGRCNALEGRDGAYNLYENEIRQDRIIADLDEAVTQLEQIKKNQYLLYTEVDKLNSSVKTMTRQVDRAVKELTKQTAIAADANALLTKSNSLLDSLGLLTAMK